MFRRGRLRGGAASVGNTNRERLCRPSSPVLPQLGLVETLTMGSLALIQAPHFVPVAEVWLAAPVPSAGAAGAAHTIASGAALLDSALGWPNVATWPPGVLSHLVATQGAFLGRIILANLIHLVLHNTNSLLLHSSVHQDVRPTPSDSCHNSIGGKIRARDVD